MRQALGAHVEIPCYQERKINLPQILSYLLHGGCVVAGLPWAEVNRDQHKADSSTVNSYGRPVQPKTTSIQLGSIAIKRVWVEFVADVILRAHHGTSQGTLGSMTLSRW